jgi:hypothetical protein
MPEHFDKQKRTKRALKQGERTKNPSFQYLPLHFLTPDRKVFKSK